LRYFELNQKLSSEPISERVPQENKQEELESLVISDEEAEEADSF